MFLLTLNIFNTFSNISTVDLQLVNVGWVTCQVLKLIFHALFSQKRVSIFKKHLNLISYLGIVYTQRGKCQKSFSGRYFPVFALNTEIYSVNLRIKSEYRNIGKYGPEKTPYLDSFHAVISIVKFDLSAI